MQGGASYGDSGKLVVAGVVARLSAESVGWGDPSSEVARFVSDDGGACFRGEIIGAAAPDVPRWLPNV